MIVQKHFLSKLKDFGLNSYEAKLWTALLSQGVATAGELSDIANVPRSRSYDVLESLERKGFVIMKLGKPIKYIAIPPTEVIERVKKKVHEDAVNQEKLLDELNKSEVLSELNSLHSQGVTMVEPTELTGTIKGRPNLYNHLASLIQNAEKSVLIMTTDKGLKRKAEVLHTALEKAKKKGVKVKILAPSNTKEKLKLPATVRYLDGSVARFCVIDGKQTTFMALDDAQTHPSYDFGVWVSAEQFSKSFENLFQKLWDKAKN